MATEENQTHVGAVVSARRASPPPAGGGAGRRVGRVNNNNDAREGRRFPDQLWESKQRRSPSLVFYRKLSRDDEKGTLVDGGHDCLDYSSDLRRAEEENNCPEQLVGRRIEAITKTFTPTPASPSEGSPRQLDLGGEGVGAGGNRTVSARCSCAVPNADRCHCHSPRSGPSPGSSPGRSPRLSPGTSRPILCHVRRGSLPVSVLASCKVIKGTVPAPAAHTICTFTERCISPFIVCAEIIGGDSEGAGMGMGVCVCGGGCTWFIL